MEENGYIIYLCDNEGNAKAIASWFKREDVDKVVTQMKIDEMVEYVDKIKIPV